MLKKRFKDGKKILVLTFPMTLREVVLGSSPLNVSQIKQPRPHMSEDLSFTEEMYGMQCNDDYHQQM